MTDEIKKILCEDTTKITEEQHLLMKALVLAEDLFRGKMDKSGEPYFNHLYRVMKSCPNYDSKVVALLHDAVEDTELTFKDLENLGFPSQTVEAVRLLTKPHDISYERYIKKIIASNNEDALFVKYYDMLDNSSERRLEKLDPSTQERLRKKYRIISELKVKIKRKE